MGGGRVSQEVLTLKWTSIVELVLLGPKGLCEKLAPSRRLPFTGYQGGWGGYDYNSSNYGYDYNSGYGGYGGYNDYYNYNQGYGSGWGNQGGYYGNQGGYGGYGGYDQGTKN